MRSPGIAWLFSVAVGLCWATIAVAAVCNVPSGAHPTIQAAVDDAGCTEVVLAARVFGESADVGRSLTVTGASATTTTVEGRFVVTGATTDVALNNLTVNAAAPSTAGCYSEGLDVTGGARLTSNALVVINGDGACPLFSDGFESGSTSAWSMATP